VGHPVVSADYQKLIFSKYHLCLVLLETRNGEGSLSKHVCEKFVFVFVYSVADCATEKCTVQTVLLRKKCDVVVSLTWYCRETVLSLNRADQERQELAQTRHIKRKWTTNGK
jgi:hypothetical protein